MGTHAADAEAWLRHFRHARELVTRLPRAIGRREPAGVDPGLLAEYRDALREAAADFDLLCARARAPTFADSVADSVVALEQVVPAQRALERMHSEAPGGFW